MTAAQRQSVSGPYTEPTPPRSHLVFTAVCLLVVVAAALVSL